MAKEKAKLSFAGRSLDSKKGRLDEMIRAGKTNDEMIKMLVKDYANKWAENVIRWHVKDLEKAGKITVKVETTYAINGK